MANVSVIYYSSTGTNAALAKAVAEGASSSGAEVRVRLVPETVAPEIIKQNAKWQAFVDATQAEPKATVYDLEWADAVVFGSPTRYGNVTAQLKAFLDSTGGLWSQGKLANKVYAGFTSAQTVHGGQESTLLALYNTIYHFGGIIATPGYTDPLVFGAGGNPYGPSVTTGNEGKGPNEAELAHARYLGRRVTEIANKLRSS
jgi:NAD(P)H dehydrogenase (quinone)